MLIMSSNKNNCIDELLFNLNITIIVRSVNSDLGETFLC